MSKKLRLEAIGISNYYIQLFDFHGKDLEVETGLFGKKPNRVIAVVNVEGEDELDTHEMDTVEDFFTNYVNSGNDGGLLWIPAKHAAVFPEFASVFMMNAYDAGKLNLNNGPVSEALVMYPAEDGLVVAMIDPECDSGVWADLVAEFKNKYGVEEQDGFTDFSQFDTEKVFWFEGSHLAANMNESWRYTASVNAFLDVLKIRNMMK